MVDPIFGDPRLAEIYDALDGDRDDLDLYEAVVEEVEARSVLDIGCGTGSFACRLAARGVTVVGLDPAEASLAVACRKAGAPAVRWIHGDVTALPPLDVDLVVMTGNVAQVFTSDDEWSSVLGAAAAALRPGGWLVFEVRDPAREAWTEWNRERSFRRTDIPGVGPVESWSDLTEVALPLVSFRWTFAFASDGAVLTSDSTLRFRTRPEVAASLQASGFSVHDVRDAPDRPGRELVFLARRDPSDRSAP